MQMLGKLIGGGLASIALGGAAIGVGIVFGCQIIGTSRNPSLRSELFNFSIQGFAQTEAQGLFGQVICLMILYAF